jgi:hypothetical protein
MLRTETVLRVVRDFIRTLPVKLKRLLFSVRALKERDFGIVT